MAVEKVQLGVTAIKELLDNGYTWLKKDDLGFGSIQEKYQASEVQIATIRKHPLLKDLETTARIFVIIDDTKENGVKETALSVNGLVSTEHLASIPGSDKSSTDFGSGLLQVSQPDNAEAFTEADSFSAFNSL